MPSGTWSTTTVEDGAPGVPLGNATLELADVYAGTTLAPSDDERRESRAVG